MECENLIIPWNEMQLFGNSFTLIWRKIFDVKRSFSCLCNYSAERRQKILDSFQSSIVMNSGCRARFKREDGFWWVPCGQFPAQVRVQLNIRGLSLWAQWVLLDKTPKPRPLETRGGFCHQLSLSSLTNGCQGTRCFYLGRLGKTDSHAGQFLMA